MWLQYFQLTLSNKSDVLCWCSLAPLHQRLLRMCRAVSVSFSAPAHMQNLPNSSDHFPRPAVALVWLVQPYSSMLRTDDWHLDFFFQRKYWPDLDSRCGRSSFPGKPWPVCGDYHVTKTVTDVADGVHNFIKCWSLLKRMNGIFPLQINDNLEYVFCCILTVGVKTEYWNCVKQGMFLGW